MTFADFYRAVRGYDPFPWQERLAASALAGNWPSSIALPTAAGKTSLIDIAVYALAMGAPGAARRIFFVVDRRVIVDEAEESARELRDKLFRASSGTPLGELATKLCEIGGDPHPLETAVLRGGVPGDCEWAKSPIQPYVICSTVDQVGSSMLFRAYGQSEYAWPIRAALATSDSLIILDEAHTSQPFAETLARLKQYCGWAEKPLAKPFRVVEMSATPNGSNHFKEDEEDCRNVVLKRRWEASKRAALVEVDPAAGEEALTGGFTALINGMLASARNLAAIPNVRVVGVIANRVRTARRIYEALSKDQEVEVILMTGRSRSYDRDELWNEWKDKIKLGREKQPERLVYVVATQCIEVGANLDFDALVTEIASMDALEQRFGRLNRNGSYPTVQAAIVAQKDQTKAKYIDAVYGESLGTTWAWLQAHRTANNVPLAGPRTLERSRNKKSKADFVEFGVLVLRKALSETPQADRSSLVMPRRSAPVLMPSHLDLLAQTNPAPALTPEPAVFLHGPETGPEDVQVIWRADLRENLAGDTDPNHQSAIFENIGLCPPAAPESISLPVWEVKKWLSSDPGGDLSDIEGGQFEREPRTDSQIFKRAVIWQGPENSRLVLRPGQIKPGMTLIVPSSYGGCDKFGWNPESEERVQDVGDFVKLRARRPTLRLDKSLDYAGDVEALLSAKTISDARQSLGQIAQRTEHGYLRDLARALTKGPLKISFTNKSDEKQAVALSGSLEFQEDFSAFEGREIELSEHLSGCAEWARKFSRDLPEELRQTVIRTAEVHDLGKSDPRFQAWLRGGYPVSSRQLLAKSKGNPRNPAILERSRELAGYPKGGRHELLSTAMLLNGEANIGIDFDLLLHLVASHHGRCRPFAPVIRDEMSIHVQYEEWHASTKHNLEKLASGVSTRFWKLTRRYGWYGLSYLECLIRLADQRQSNQERKEESAEVANA